MKIYFVKRNTGIYTAKVDGEDRPNAMIVLDKTFKKYKHGYWGYLDGFCVYHGQYLKEAKEEIKRRIENENHGPRPKAY